MEYFIVEKSSGRICKVVEEILGVVYRRENKVLDVCFNKLKNIEKA